MTRFIVNMALFLLLMFFGAYESAFSISIGNVTSAQRSGTNQATLTFNHDNNGDYLVVLVGVESTSAKSVSSLTYNGVALTEAVDQINNNLRVCSIYYLTNPAIGINTVSFDLSANSADRIAIAVSIIDAADEAPDITASNTAAASTSIALTHVPNAINGESANIALGCYKDNAALTFSADLGQTEQANIAEGPDLSISGVTAISSSSQTYDWSGSASNDWAAVAAEIKQPLGGSTRRVWKN
ncbi:MAG: hypothetical protein RIG61_07415 [Deltaproteobacteria bacterium]